jgi:hypothetical protein
MMHAPLGPTDWSGEGEGVPKLKSFIPKCYKSISERNYEMDVFFH